MPYAGIEPPSSPDADSTDVSAIAVAPARPPSPARPPTPVVTAWVRKQATLGDQAPQMRVEQVTLPLLLAMPEGVYIGSTDGGSASPVRYWFAFWDEVISSTIPLPEAPVGHPAG